MGAGVGVGAGVLRLFRSGKIGSEVDNKGNLKARARFGGQIVCPRRFPPPRPARNGFRTGVNKFVSKNPSNFSTFATKLNETGTVRKPMVQGTFRDG